MNQSSSEEKEEEDFGEDNDFGDEPNQDMFNQAKCEEEQYWFKEMERFGKEENDALRVDEDNSPTTSTNTLTSTYVPSMTRKIDYM